jgi:hypothetical protein
LTSPEGSAVLPKSRFFRYVLSFFNATANLDHPDRSHGGIRNENPY